MEMLEYEEHQTQLQRVTRDWLLENYPTNTFVTLTFSAEAGVSYSDAEGAFGSFVHRLRSHLHGAKSKKLIPMVPVVEGYDKCYGMSKKLGMRESTHIHCLMNLDGNPKDLMHVVRRCWLDSSPLCGDPHIYCPNSDDWFLDLDTVKKRRIFVNYSLKTCTTNLDAVLVKFVPIRLPT